MPKFTKEQQEAIDARGTNIIVSAGAGSGKTAVLSERVLEEVKNETHINNLLVLTFTKAAAKEMKDRIRSKLIKNNLTDEVELIDSAYITTFDSFCLSLVKKYHYVLGVSRDIKISDQISLDILKKDLLTKLIENYYKNNDQEVIDFIVSFSIKDDKDFINMIIKLYNKLELITDRKKFFDNYLSYYYDEKKIKLDLDSYIKNIVDLFNELKSNIMLLESKLPDKSSSALHDATSSIYNVNDYNDIKDVVEKLSLPRVNKDYDDECKNIKEIIKGLKDDINKLCIYDSTMSMKKELLETFNDSKIIIKILSELDSVYTTEKSNRSLYNFNDIASMAINLLKNNDDICDEVKNSFYEILVDEYQDTSDVQEELINLISKNNVYMVGDIKQSIYRFRNANPKIFKDKYNLYSNTDRGIKIDLNKNFRSRREVLDNINMLFNHIMDLDLGGADYKESHQAIFGNNRYLEVGATPQKYDFNIYAYDKDIDDDYTNTEKEAFIIANDIKEKIKNKYQIFDKDKEVIRDACYSDFVILLDKKKNFDLYKKIFEYLNVPLTVFKEENINNQDDFLVLYNLLKLIVAVGRGNYSTDTKYSYVSVARSYLFRYDDNYIFESIKNDSYKDDEIIKIALSFKNGLDTYTPSEFYNDVLNKYNYYDRILTTTDIEKKEAVLEYLYNVFSELESNAYDIDDIIYYLDKVIEDSYDIKYDNSIVDSDSVRIMTIHKSKGLEFPVCYFADLENKFNMRDLTEKVIFSKDYGILVPQLGETYKKTIRNLLYVDNERKEEISERIRLFYVALTRCREHMILVCPKFEIDSDCYSIVPSNIRKKYTSFYSILKSISYSLCDYIVDIDNINLTKDYLYKLDTKEFESNNADNLVVNELSKEKIEVSDEHFSKTKLEIISEDEDKLLKFGTKAHLYLEQLDFKNPNLDIIDDSFLKEKISKFINSDIIKKNIDAKFYKEYEFIEQDIDSIKHGIIDLMIENDKEIIIIDYKLKHIDDLAYKDQLAGYKNYISSITNKNVSTYLYSIMDSEFKKIEC